MEKIECFVMDSFEFDELVEKTYGKPYEFAIDRESYNDTDYLFRKITKDKRGLLPDSDLIKFVETGNYSCIYQKLLQDLCNKEILQEGNYLIQVSW